MQESNILSARITAHFDDFDGSTATQGPLNQDLMATIYELLARPHSHSNNDRVTHLFQKLAQNTLLYTGSRYVQVNGSIERLNLPTKLLTFLSLFSGPQFCTLPLELQQHVLTWYRVNLSALDPLNKVGADLLRAILSYAHSNDLAAFPLHSFASTILEDVLKIPIEHHSSQFPHMEAFCSALQADLLLRFDSSIPHVLTIGYYREALYELDHGVIHGRSLGDMASQQALLSSGLEVPDDDILPNFMNSVGMNDDAANPFIEAITDQLAEEPKVENDRLPTSSQHHEMGVLMEVDIPLASTVAEEEVVVASAQGLSELERASVLSLGDRLSGLDSNLQSQLQLSHGDVSVLVDCYAISEAIALLEVQNLSEETLFALIQAILSVDAPFMRLRILFSELLLWRIQNLAKTASRTLLNTLHSVADKEPTALLQAVLVPLVSHPSFAAHHVELLIRIVKGVPHPIQEAYAESLLRTGPNPLTIAYLDLIAKLIPIRTQWTSSIVYSIIHQVYVHINDAFEGNKQGEKIQTIVWTLLQKYPSQDLKSQKERLQSITLKFPSPIADKNAAKIALM